MCIGLSITVVGAALRYDAHHSMPLVACMTVVVLDCAQLLSVKCYEGAITRLPCSEVFC